MARPFSHGGMRAPQGTAIVSAGSRVGQQPVGRVCEEVGCKTILSRYNENPACSIHETERRLTANQFFTK